MLQVWPSIWSRRAGSACMALTASSSTRWASGRSVERSKSKCTSSNVYCLTGGRRTSTLTVAWALPPLPSSTVTVHVTGPSCWPPIHPVSGLPEFSNLPLGQDHRYVSLSPSGSCALAESVKRPPGSPRHGLHAAVTVGGRFAGGGGGGAGAGGGGGGGGT